MAETWLHYLKQSNCKGLQLCYKENPTLLTKYTEWFFEALYDNFSNYWSREALYSPRENAGFETYQLTHKGVSPTSIQIDSGKAKTDFHQSMQNISAFCYQKLNNIFLGDWYKEAERVLESNEPEKYFHHLYNSHYKKYSSLIIPEESPLHLKQLLFAAILSMSDTKSTCYTSIVDKNQEVQNEYRIIKEQLNQSLNNAIFTGVNSIFAF